MLNVTGISSRAQLYLLVHISNYMCFYLGPLKHKLMGSYFTASNSRSFNLHDNICTSLSISLGFWFSKGYNRSRCGFLIQH